jgi:hypothetical protein
VARGSRATPRILRGVRLDHLLARSVLAASALIHLYFGAAFALDPLPWMAFYGGLMLALGTLFAVTAVARGALHSGLVLMTATYLGAATVRTLSLAADRVADPLLQQILFIETAGAILGAFCLWRRVS